MKQTETEKKVRSSSAAKKPDLKKSKKAQKNAEPVFQKPWETHMQEVYGRSVSLSHPAIEPGEVTAEYGISPSSFPLQAGFTVMPTGNGQVGAYYDKTSGRQGSMFGAIGGMAEFAPPNLKGVKVLAQLDTFNLIADKEVETENEDDSETESPLNAAPQIDKIALPALDMQQQSTPMMDKITLPALDAAELEQQGIAQMDEIALPPSESEALQQQFAPQIDRISLPPLDMAAIQEETLEQQQENAPLGETKISAYLKGALVIEPCKGFKMELDEAEYIKHENESNPKLKFWKTKLTYHDRPVAPQFESESDETGLHAVGNSAIELDKNKLGDELQDLDKDNVKVEFVMDEDGAGVIISSLLEFFDENDLEDEEETIVEGEEFEKMFPAHETLYSAKNTRKELKAEEAPAFEEPVAETIIKEDIFKVGDAAFYLGMVRKVGEEIVSVESAKSVYGSYDLKLKNIKLLDNPRAIVGDVEEMKLLTKPNVVILCDALACDESNGMYAEEAIFKRGEKEYILEEVDFGEKEQIFAKRVGCVVDGYETILHDAVFRAFGDVDFQSAEVMTVLHYGLNQNEKNKYIEDAQAFFTFNLGAGALANGRFVNGTQSLDLASQQKQINTGANSRKSTQIEKDIFTDDGFVQLEDAKFDFEKSGEESSKVKGEGRFRLLEIPYVIAVSDKKELRGETQQKRDAEGNMAFTIDDKGDINAQFDNPVVLNILEARNEADNVTSAIMLKGAAIKDSMLTAKDIQVERGFGIDKETSDENDSDIEKAAKMFGFGFHVAFANVGEVKSLDRLGIYAVAKKKKLGAFGVSDFLGFLDVSGNYAAGQLHAALKKDKKYGDKKDDQKDEEKKNGFSTIFGDEKEVKGEGDSGNGLGIPLGGPLSFVFSIKPVIGIGGMLSADLQRGEGRGFDEEMTPDETMDLKGSLNVDGFAALNASAGVAAGLNVITNIASVDIKLNASIGGGIGAELAGGTKLKKEEGKLAQANDLAINGNLKTYVKGTLSLSSDVRVFIWKAQIFKINLAEKRVDFSPLSVQISRKMGAKGLTDGWNFESAGLSADVFGKKAFGAIRDASKQPDPEPMKITQEEIDTAGEDIKSAWAVLQDLRNEKKMTEQRAYFLTPVEKAALDERIQTMTAQVKADLEKYLEKLKLYKNQLQEDEAAAAEEVKKARGEQEDYEQRKRIKDKALNDVEKAGFDAKNYRPLTVDNAPEMSEREREKENTRRKEMSSIDFAIARIIGIYDNAIADTMRDYDAFAQNKNKQMLEKDKNTPKDKLYKLSNEMQDHEFVFHDFDSWGKNHDLLKYATSFGSNGSNYYDALSVYAINRDEREKYGIYRKAFRRKNRFGEPEISDMTGRELLEIILRDKYPKGACDAKGNDRAGRPIGATPQQKMEALEYLFKKQLSVDVNDEDAQYLLKTTKKGLKLDQMRHDTDEVYQALFNSAMEKMTRKGNVDIDTKLAELEQKFAKAKEKHLQAIQNHLDAQTAVVKVEAELASSKAKLDELEGNVAKATALESGAPESATAALDFVEGSYKDIASGKTMVDALEGHEKAKEAMLGNSPSGTTAESISGNEPQ